MADTLELPESNLGFLRGQIEQPKTGVLKAPDNIIQTVQGAKALYFQYRTEHLRRIDLYAAIEGLIAGNPPYSPADLAKHKLSHITNYNNLDARALYERGALAYWNLLNEAETLVKFEIRPGKWMGQLDALTIQSAQKDPQLTEWASIMAIHWNKVVRSWPSFSVAFNTLAGQLVKFGVSPALFPDERDWRWRTVELSRFFVEDGAQTDIALLPAVCVETIFTAQYLFEIYEQFKDKAGQDVASSNWNYSDCPWNIRSLSALLVWIANSSFKDQTNFADMMDVQQYIQTKALTWNSVFSDSIRLASLFYQEYDGQISHYMFHPKWDDGGFLFFQSKQYKKMEDGIIIFTASPGEFTIHSNRGLGHKIFSSSQALMQLDCSIIDMARMSGTPIIQGLSTGSQDFEAIRFYPGVPTNVGSATFVQNNLGNNIQQVIAAAQYTQSKIQYNTTNSGDDPSMPDKNVGSVSPTEARTKSYKEFGVLKNNIAHFYSYLDKLFTSMTVKMLKSKETYPGHEYVEEWKRCCIEDGVPEEIFSMGKLSTTGMPYHLNVRATRVAGDGSTVARIMGLQELALVAPDFGPSQARAYQREWVLATMGPEYIPTFGPSNDADETAGGASLAGVENAVMQAGQSAIFSPDNEHKAHFATHMAVGMNIIERIQQQQIDPVTADKTFAVLIPHMNEHWQVLLRSIFAKSFVAQAQKGWNQLTQYATLNHKNAAKQLQGEIKKRQELEAQQNEALSDIERKNMVAAADIKRKDVQAAAKEERADEQSDVKAQNMREQIQTNAANDRLKITLEANNKSVAESKKALASAPIESLRSDLSDINGATPSPYDLEL